MVKDSPFGKQSNLWTPGGQGVKAQTNDNDAVLSVVQSPAFARRLLKVYKSVCGLITKSAYEKLWQKKLHTAGKSLQKVTTRTHDNPWNR